MTTITTRNNKGSELSYNEGDANLDIDIQTANANYTADADDNRAVYECTGTFNFTLPAAATIVNPPTTNNNDYEVTVKNVSTGTITVKTSGADTLDGTAAPGNFSVADGDCFTFKVNNAKDGYVITGSYSENLTASTINASTELQVGGTKFHTIAILAGNNTSISAGGNQFGSFNSVSAQLTEGANQFHVPVAGIIKNLHTYINSFANSLSGNLVLVVNKNGANQAVTVTYSAGQDGKKSDTSNSFSVAQGDLISLELTAAAGSGAATLVSWAVELAVA